MTDELRKGFIDSPDLQERQPQPDDLVEKIIKSVTNNSGVVVFSGSAKIVTHKETAKAEIRKLLSRNDFGISCVTREEIERVIYEALPGEPLKTVLAVEAVVQLFKFKGIDVKGEK